MSSEVETPEVEQWPLDYESLRRAARWLTVHHYQEPEVPLARQFQKVVLLFDLKPDEQQALQELMDAHGR